MKRSERRENLCHVDAVNASPPVLWDVIIRRRFVVGEDLFPDSEPLSPLDLEGLMNPPFRGIVF